MYNCCYNSGCLNKKRNTIPIWRNATLDPWNSHGMLYLHDWWSTGSGMVHSLMTESQSLYSTFSASIINLYKRTVGASEHCLRATQKSQGTWTYLGPPNRLINVIDLGDIQGLRPNIAWTITLYESQWCDDVAIVEHVRHNHPERH